MSLSLSVALPRSPRGRRPRRRTATGVLATGVLATGVLVTGVLVTGVLVTGALAAAALDGAAGAMAATRSPLDALPSASPPRTVPYAIGTSVFFNGRVTDVSARFDRAFPGGRLRPEQRQVTTVVGGGGFAWVQLTGPGADLVHVVGRIGPRGGWTGFHSSSGSMSLVAVTPAGAVAMPESGQLFGTDGRMSATLSGSPVLSCGFCGAEAAGPHLVVERKPSGPGDPHRGWWLWTPPAAPVRLPDRTRALGRLGTGWLGVPDGAGCWRVAPATLPEAVRVRICSQALPLVSPDGTRAAVVQAGRMRIVDTRTGTRSSIARLGPMASWSPDGAGGAVRYVVPAAWEGPDTYLAVARDDRALAVVRCSVRTGRCQRAVRSTVRAGVSGIVLERGPEDVVASPASS